MNNKEKLLIVTRSTVYHNKSGGLETQLNNLVEYLKDYFDITILTTAYPYKKTPPKINQTKILRGVKYIFLKNSVPGEYGFTLYESLFWQVPFKHNIKSLNTNFRKQASLYYDKYLKKGFKVILSQSSSAQNFNIDTHQKLILINHGTSLNEIKNRYNSVKGLKHFIRFLLLDLPVLVIEACVNNPILFKKAFKIVLISNRLKKDFEKQHKIFVPKTVVIPNGINTNVFKPLNKNDSFTVVYVGRIDYEKGLDNFISVAKNLPKIRFEIYGDGPDSRDIKNQTPSVKNIIYKGSVSNKEIAKVFGTSHVFLFLTKRKEGMPMTILESLSSGCVVVTTLKDSSISGKNGYFNIDNVKKATNKIEYLYKNYKEYAKLSTQSKLYATSNYDYRVMGASYLHLLKKLY